jgi:hypothetical protein
VVEGVVFPDPHYAALQLLASQFYRFATMASEAFYILVCDFYYYFGILSHGKGWLSFLGGDPL